MLHVVLRDNPSTVACLLSVDVPACRSAVRISSILDRCRTFMLDRSSTGLRCNDGLRAGCAGESRTSIVMAGLLQDVPAHRLRADRIADAQARPIGGTPCHG